MRPSTSDPHWDASLPPAQPLPSLLALARAEAGMLPPPRDSSTSPREASPRSRKSSPRSPRPDPELTYRRAPTPMALKAVASLPALPSAGGMGGTAGMGKASARSHLSRSSKLSSIASSPRLGLHAGARQQRTLEELAVTAARYNISREGLQAAATPRVVSTGVNEVARPHSWRVTAEAR